MIPRSEVLLPSPLLMSSPLVPPQLMSRGTSALARATPAPAAGHIPSAKLTDAAHQFEASLMQELMEPLEHDALGNDQDSADHDASTDALGSFAREAMARALSAAGGFGIARTILHSFSETGKAR